MSEQKTEQVEAPENPQTVEETTSENTFDKDKFFRGAYNEGKQKVERDVVNTFSELFGDKFETFDDVVNVVKQRVAKPEANSKTDDSVSAETQELRKMLDDYRNQAEQAKQELKKTRIQSQVSTQLARANSELTKEYELSIDNTYIEKLFTTEYEIKDAGDSVYVSKDGVPVLDDSGNRKSVASTYAEFAKQFAKPRKTGVGGTTGVTTSNTQKPSRKEWSALVRSGKTDQATQEKMAELFNTAKEVGWSE